ADCDGTFEVDIKLINGTVKENYPVVLANTVLAEKTRIWAQENQRGPPELADVVLVLVDPHGGQKLMDDHKRIEDYLDNLASSSIEFIYKRQP
ncbi:unnamed protein product, partial [Candidula unifasciata]